MREYERRGREKVKVGFVLGNKRIMHMPMPATLGVI